MKKTPWHSFDLPEIYSRIGASDRGLSQTQVAERYATYGANELPPEKAEPVWRLFLNQFNSPLMYIMMAAIGISVFMGNAHEAIFILVVMSSNAIVGFYQEHKANQSLRSLKGLIKLRARVIRDDREQEIDAAALVPGDIVILRSGDKVPADGRILELSGLRVNEASLTGESKSIEKKVDVLPSDIEVGDRLNMVFMGTMVEEGSARVIILETGARTEYGDIVTLLKETPEEATPLQRTLATLTKIIGIFIFCAVLVIVGEGFLSGRNFQEVFSASLALFVSAIPEGLLPAITIVLALGMRRILKQKGLVRRLAATETLGGVTVIATDKTGTLTEGKMEVSKIIVSDPAIEQDMLKIAALSNDAFVENPGADPKEFVIRGTMTEQALLMAAYRGGYDKAKLEKEEPLVDRLFFSSENKYSASLRQTGDGKRRFYVVGAPERVLARSTKAVAVEGDFDITSDVGQKLVAGMEEAIGKGYRVVGCAVKEVPADATFDSLPELAQNLSLVGFFAISDPVRADVPAAFALTRQAGIRTVVVTGDHKQTALAVTRKVGFDIGEDQVLEGQDIEHLTDEQLRERVRTVSLYARVSPRHKLRIVQAFQHNGEVVAVFGDGVNDAPALKAANIGVAVGTEVDAVREVADVVLLDSGFGTIVKAVEQGRIIFDNIKRVFLYLITQDFSQFFIFMASIMLGLPLPLIAAQLLLVNLVESGLPDLALTLEQEKDGIMDRPPRNPNGSFLDTPARLWMVSIFAVSGTVAMLFYMTMLRVTGGDIALVRTMMTVLMCFESLFLVFAVRSFFRPIWRRDIFGNYTLTLAVAISFMMLAVVVYAAPMQRLFQTVSLTLSEWGYVLVANLIGIFIIDKLKLLYFRGKKKYRSASISKLASEPAQSLSLRGRRCAGIRWRWDGWYRT